MGILREASQNVAQDPGSLKPKGPFLAMLKCLSQDCERKKDSTRSCPALVIP